MKDKASLCPLNAHEPPPSPLAIRGPGLSRRSLRPPLERDHLSEERDASDSLEQARDDPIDRRLGGP